MTYLWWRVRAFRPEVVWIEHACKRLVPAHRPPICLSLMSGRWKTRIADSLVGAPAHRYCWRAFFFRHCRAPHRHRCLWSVKLCRGRSRPVARSACVWRWGHGRHRSGGSLSRLRHAYSPSGLVLGAIGAWLAGRAMQDSPVPRTNSPLGDRSPRPAGNYGYSGSCGLVCLPSQRAARISPMEALADQ